MSRRSPDLKCPLCEREYRNILQHLAITHEIRSIDALRAVTEGVERRNKEKEEFNAYVKVLQQQRAKGQISAETYRELVTRWFRDRRLESSSG